MLLAGGQPNIAVYNWLQLRMEFVHGHVLRNFCYERRVHSSIGGRRRDIDPSCDIRSEEGRTVEEPEVLCSSEKCFELLVSDYLRMYQCR
jgi:hypothetical protein